MTYGHSSNYYRVASLSKVQLPESSSKFEINRRILTCLKLRKELSVSKFWMDPNYKKASPVKSEQKAYWGNTNKKYNCDSCPNCHTLLDILNILLSIEKKE